MALKTSKIAVIAGDGTLPVQIIERCIEIDKPYFLMVVKGHGKEVLKKFKPDDILQLNKIGKAIKLLKYNKIKDIIMIGSIERPSLKNMLPDLWTAKFIAKLTAKPKGDDNIIKQLVVALEEEGFNLVAPESYIGKSFAKKGIIGKISPNESNLLDITLGFSIAKNISRHDIGQSLVIENGHVLAIEAAEGTNAMILRASKFIKFPGSAVLIKVLKYNQEKRIDRPAIGIKTVTLLKKAGFAGAALESNEVIIVDFEKTISNANKNKIFIKGV